MTVLGLNIGETKFGKKNRDGGAALLGANHELSAIAEERVTGLKRIGGYKESTRYLRENWPSIFRDVELVVQSTCCEPQREETINSLGIEHLINSDIPVISCNHHLSHALGAFCTSKFEEALICVIDSGGNTLDDKITSTWWQQPREQASFFHGSSNGINIIARDFSDPFEAGFGEIYRALTYFLGWHSGQYSGNSMALAGYYLRATEEIDLFFNNINGRVFSRIQNNPQNPNAMIECILSCCNIPPIKKREKDAIFFDESHLRIAYTIQNAIDNTIINRVKWLVKYTGLKKVCLSGGVAYNCPLIGHLMSCSEIEDVYVHPASGDQGQCFGNALFGRWQIDGKVPRLNSFSPYLGKVNQVTVDELTRQCKNANLSAEITEPSDIIKTTAEFLANGEIIAWYSGRSEFGPRALGARSLLAHPMIKDSRRRMNKIKQRYGFTPVAPAILLDKCSKFVEHVKSLPYMTAAIRVHQSVENTYPLFCHSDGSCRIQTVSESDHPLFFRLLLATEEITGCPALLNTSLNQRGKPLVETVEDVVRFMAETNVNIGIIEGKLLKISNTSGEEQKMGHLRDKVILALSFLGKDGIDSDSLRKRISYVLPDYELVPRNRFALDINFMQWVSSKRKVTTIRYNRSAVDYPITQTLPVVGTERFDSGDTGKQVGTNYKVVSYTIKEFGDLDDNDGIRDGFSGRDELLKTLLKIYGHIHSNEPVSIYGIEEVAQSINI